MRNPHNSPEFPEATESPRRSFSLNNVRLWLGSAVLGGTLIVFADDRFSVAQRLGIGGVTTVAAYTLCEAAEIAMDYALNTQESPSQE